MSYKFSVVVPLYNKQNEIYATIASILAQSYKPHEIIIVDDGSTDGGSNVVRSFNSPLIRLIEQRNAGQSVARNRAIAESTGQYIALLDADDTWESGYLEKMALLIDSYPGCGAYCSAFNIVSTKGLCPSNSPAEEGIIENYFKMAMHYYICIPSATTIAKHVFEKVGGFPDGMKLGEDLFMWVKMVTAGFEVCYTPDKLCNYSLIASNRSTATYIAEVTNYSLQSYYKEGDFFRNEYIAKCEIGKAITLSAKGCTEQARNVEKFYKYTKLNKLAWRKLYCLNRLPSKLRPKVFAFYNRMAWLIAKKGL